MTFKSAKQRKAVMAKLTMMKEYPYRRKFGDWELSDAQALRMNKQVRYLKKEKLKPIIKDWQYAGGDEPASVIIVKTNKPNIIAKLKRKNYFEGDDDFIK